jgi:hypothetical protein
MPNRSCKSLAIFMFVFAKMAKRKSWVGSTKQGDEIGLMLPELHYWDTLFIETDPETP